MQLVDSMFERVAQKGALFSLIFLGSLILQFFLPWWICAAVAFIAAFWQANSARQAFLVGGAAIGLLWCVLALFWHFGSAGILSDKVASVFKLNSGLSLIGVVTLIAALLGGNAALSGYLVKALFKK